MHKYAVTYYEFNGADRVPLSGVDVRLVRQGGSFEDGKLMSEVITGSGHYEITLTDSSDTGYYEIWDDVNNPSGAYTGRSTFIGQVDEKTLKDLNVYSKHLANSAVTQTKIANDSIVVEHLKSTLKIPFDRIDCEVANHDNAIGSTSGLTPPTDDDDECVIVLSGTYKAAPKLTLTHLSPNALWVKVVDYADGVVTIILGVVPIELQNPEFEIIAFK